MMKTYEEQIRMLTRDCDVNGQWRISAILEAMQEAAGAHSFLLGCGRDELLKNNSYDIITIQQGSIQSWNYKTFQPQI